MMDDADKNKAAIAAINGDGVEQNYDVAFGFFNDIKDAKQKAQGLGILRCAVFQAMVDKNANNTEALSSKFLEKASYLSLGGILDKIDSSLEAMGVKSKPIQPKIIMSATFEFKVMK